MRQLDIFSAPSGRELGHEAAKAAAQRADRQVADWQRQAFNAFVDYSRRAGGEFITKEVREWAKNVPPPPDPRAWGHIAMQAKRKGYVMAVGVRQERHVHGSTVTVWKAR